MLNRVKLLRKNNRDCVSSFIFSLIFSFGSTHLKVDGDGRVTPPSPPNSFFCFMSLFSEPFNVNIKCMNLLHLVYSLLQSILSQSTNSEALFSTFSFHDSYTLSLSLFVSSFQKHSSHLCIYLPETFASIALGVFLILPQ